LNRRRQTRIFPKITGDALYGSIEDGRLSEAEVDNAIGDQAAKRAIVQSAEANVRRLEELESFKHIYAPFSGVLTQRSTIRTLINAGNGGTSQQLFYLAQTDPIRVYVNVPEPFCTFHSCWTSAAYLELTQYPRREIPRKSCAHVECD